MALQPFIFPLHHAFQPVIILLLYPRIIKQPFILIIAINCPQVKFFLCPYLSTVSHLGNLLFLSLLLLQLIQKIQTFPLITIKTPIFLHLKTLARLKQPRLPKLSPSLHTHLPAILFCLIVGFCCFCPNSSV